jgi:hypothetical protein
MLTTPPATMARARLASTHANQQETHAQPDQNAVLGTCASMVSAVHHAMAIQAMAAALKGPHTAALLQAHAMTILAPLMAATTMMS